MGKWSFSFFLTLLVWTFPGQDVNAQSRPSGVYASAQDWLEGHASEEYDPSVRKVSHKNGYVLFKFNNANGYQIGDDHWGLVRNDTLYIWYEGSRFIKAEEQGRICYFKGPPFVTDGQRMAVNSNSFWFGVVGGALTAQDIHNQVKERIHYVLDTRTGRLYPLSPGRMRILLAEDPAILAAFEREVQPPSFQLMVDYIRMANTADQTR